MLEALREAIEAVEIPAEDGALRAAVALLDRLQGKVAQAVGAFDASEAWAASGATSMRAWLRYEGLCGPDAGRLVATGRRLTKLPAVAAAWADGRLSGGVVRTIVSNVPERHMGLFAEHEAGLVPTLEGLDADTAGRVLQEWVAKADALDDGDEPREPQRSLYHSPTLDGRFVIDGSFDAEGGAVVAQALALADSGDLDRPAPYRRADALVDVCRFFLDRHELPHPGGRHRPHINLLIDAGDLAAGRPSAELVDYGLRLSRQATSRLLCDCALNRVVADKVAAAPSVILDYGSTVRTVPAPLWSALVVRDVHCRFPSCDRPAHWCEAHHVQWFSRGGETRLDNLVLLCTRHHHLLHSGRAFEATLRPDATLDVAMPDGTVRSSRPPPRQAAA